MKRLFSLIGLISLACFSFFMTEKTTTVIKNVDDIMIEIKDKYKNYERMSIDAKIVDDTIIPGVKGINVDVNKSYRKMKKYGYYNDKLYVYKKIKPKISMQDHLDKYVISGNKINRNISLVFIVDSDTNIVEVLKIMNKNKVFGSLFVDDTWFSNNNELVLNLIDEGYTIGNLSHNLDYLDSSFGWMDTIIKSLSKQKQGFCYYTDNIDNLSSCVRLKNYTIKPIEINNNYLYEVKKNISNGMMISFKVSSGLEKELDSIINYIKSKGYNLVNINELLSE